MLVLLSAKFSFAQQNLADVYDKWKDGEYKYFRNWGDAELNMVEETMHKAKVQFSKNSKTGAAQISFTGTNNNGYYEHLHHGETEFVRYYSDGYNTRLHLTGNAIIIYNITETFEKIEIEILGCIGKKIGQKDVSNLKSYLEATKKYWIPKNFSDAKDQIVSVKATPIFPEGQTSVEINKSFTLGIEVEYSWGMKSKTKNLGGSIRSDSYSVLCKDVSYDKKDKYPDYILSLTPDCRFIKNNVIKFKGSAGSKEFTIDLPINCDADNSPALVYARKWSQYEEIGFTLKNGDNYERKFYTNDNGFLHCATDLEKAFNESQKNKNYLVRVKKGGKFGWADLNANLIIPCEYEGGNLGHMDNGIIAVRKGEKWGYINFQNKIMGQIKYDVVYDFKKGYGKVEMNKKQGCVNESGVEIVKPEYDQIWGFNYGAIVVKKGGKYGFVRDNGTIIGSINYDDAFDFNFYKYGFVKNNGKYGVIDLAGNIVLAIDQPSLPVSLSNDLFKIKKDGYFGVVNKSGKVIANFVYDEVYPTGYASKDAKSKESELVFRVKKGYYYGYIKSDGTVISECIFSEANDFYDGIAWVEFRDYENRLTKKGRYFLADRQVQYHEEIADPVDQDVSSTKGSSNRNSSSSSAKSDKKTLKNTGKGILYYKSGSFTGRLNGGSSTKIDCKDAVYYMNDDGKGNHTKKGSLISGANEDCGQTITATGGN